MDGCVMLWGEDTYRRQDAPVLGGQVSHGLCIEKHCEVEKGLCEIDREKLVLELML